MALKQHRKTKTTFFCKRAPKRKFWFLKFPGKHDFAIIKVWKEKDYAAKSNFKYLIYWCCEYCGTLVKEYDAEEDVILQEGIPTYSITEGNTPLIIEPPAPLQRLAERFKNMEE